MRTFTAVLYLGETGGWIVALDPETGTTTQGMTVSEALANLEDGTARFVEEAHASSR